MRFAMHIYADRHVVSCWLRRTGLTLKEQRLTQGHPSSRGIIIDPKGDPGEDCDQDGGHVCLQDEISNISFNPETQRKPWIWTCGEKGCGDSQETKNRSGVCVCIVGEMVVRRKQWHDLKSSKVCTLTMRRVVISSFVQMEHLISPKRWIPFQGHVRFQLNMAESRKPCTFFCKPLSQQAAPASLWELSQRAATLFLLHFVCPLNITKRAFQRGIIATCNFTRQKKPEKK